MMLERLATLETQFSQTNANFLHLDVQHPTGCFNLRFQNPFTSCYDSITNIVGMSFYPSVTVTLVTPQFDFQ